MTAEKGEQERRPQEATFNLDSILTELGSFGKYQLLLLLLLSFRDSFITMCQFNYVFTAAEVEHRCAISECEDFQPLYNVTFEWHRKPNDTNECTRFPLLPGMGNNLTGSTTCPPQWYDESRTVPCDKIIYEDYNSIVAEFDLGCQEWKRTLIGTIHNLGLVFSYIISGLVSDRYGRKVVIVGTPLVMGVAGIVKSFSVNYWMLLVLEFVEAALGYGNASLVLCLESVSQQSRIVFSSISDIMSNLGGALFGVIAWRIPYWRSLVRAIYAPLLVVFFYIFLLDEGVRWLIARNRKEEAVRILNKVAKMNNVTLSNTAEQMMKAISKEREKSALEVKETRGETNPTSLLAVLKSKKMRLRLSVIAVCFFCSLFVYNGAILNATRISGNKYLNFSLLLLVSVPTRVITALTLNRFGRRAPICVAFCCCAVFFISSAFVPKSMWGLPMALYLCGKMCISFGLYSLTVFAMEVFPTCSRNSLTNIANTVGRLGSVLAPQAPLLAEYMSGLPSVVFGLAALGPGVLVLLLPDVSRVRLPDDLTDAERLDAEDDKEQQQKDILAQV